MTVPHSDITIRTAVRADRAPLGRLAALDSQRPLPEGPVLVAEVDDAIVAAIHVDSARTIADPFRLTSDVIALLRLRAAPRPVARRGLGRALPHAA
jgi:hypothetical protein